MTTCLRIAVLGGFEATAPSGVPLTVPTKKAQALLAYCAMMPGRHQREKLAALLWGDTEDDHARNSLRQSLFVVRSALGPSLSRVLDVEGDTIAVHSHAIEVDAVKFQQLAAQTGPRALEAAVRLYRGDLLEGFVVDEEPFEEWVLRERERLRDRVISALTKLFHHQCEHASPESAIQTARRLLSLNPLEESMHRALISLLGKVDRRDAALRQYKSCADTLMRELKAEPEMATRQLYEQLLKGSLVSKPKPPVTATDLRATAAQLKSLALSTQARMDATAARVQLGLAAALQVCERARALREVTCVTKTTLRRTLDDLHRDVTSVRDAVGGGAPGPFNLAVTQTGGAHAHPRHR